MVIKIIKVIISKEIITGYLIAVKKVNLEVIISIKVPETLKALEIPEVPKVILGKLISFSDYLILISLYYFNIKTITPLEA